MRLFESPRSEVSGEYERLAGIARDLARRVRDVEQERAEALREARAASADLTALESRQDVDDGARKRAEKRLSAARAKADEPWAERAAGAREAARQADHAAKRFAAAHYAELSAEIGEDAQAAAAMVDDALRAVIAARLEHAAIAQRATRLIGEAGGRPRPGMVPGTRIDAVARGAEEVLLGGGESTPAPPATITLGAEVAA